MKKGRIRFYQLSIAIIWDIIVNLAFWGLCVITIVWEITDGEDGFMYKRWLFIPDWLMITVVVICFAKSVLELCRAYVYHIDFEDGIIKTDGERLTAKKFRVQFKLSIKITDITAIRVIKSNYNSLKKPSVLYNKAPATYFEFTLSNGKTKWLHIRHYSKKQRIKMINLINEELGTTYDYVEMYKNGELIRGGSIFNRERVKKKIEYL